MCKGRWPTFVAEKFYGQNTAHLAITNHVEWVLVHFVAQFVALFYFLKNNDG